MNIFITGNQISFLKLTLSKPLLLIECNRYSDEKRNIFNTKYNIFKLCTKYIYLKFNEHYSE